MRIPATTIPSEFVALDDHTTAADSFANVRDHKRMRLNHNILTAQRIRREVMHTVFNQDANDTPFSYRCRNRVGQAGVLPIIWLGQVLISQWTAEVELVIEACKDAIDGSSGFSATPKIQAKMFRDPGLPNAADLQSVSIAAAAATPTKYTMTLPVPQRRSSGAPWYGYEFYWLVIYGDTLIDTAYAKDGGLAVISQGERWVELDSASASLGYVVVCSSDLTFGYRQVVASTTTADGRRFYVDTPWDRALVVGTDVMELREIQGIDLYSWSLYELPVTSLTQRDAPL